MNNSCKLWEFVEHHAFRLSLTLSALRRLPKSSSESMLSLTGLNEGNGRGPLERFLLLPEKEDPKPVDMLDPGGVPNANLEKHVAGVAEAAVCSFPGVETGVVGTVEIESDLFLRLDFRSSLGVDSLL